MFCSDLRVPRPQLKNVRTLTLTAMEMSLLTRTVTHAQIIMEMKAGAETTTPRTLSPIKCAAPAMVVKLLKMPKNKSRECAEIQTLVKMAKFLLMTGVMVVLNTAYIQTGVATITTILFSLISCVVDVMEEKLMEPLEAEKMETLEVEKMEPLAVEKMDPLAVEKMDPLAVEKMEPLKVEKMEPLKVEMKAVQEVTEVMGR